MINSTQQLNPFQAEVGEYILTPEGDLVKSNATKKHKDMDDDFITDFQPAKTEDSPGSYIFSNDDKMKLKKKKFEDSVYGFEYFEYQSNKNGKPPKELTFDQWFTKKENTPAEIAKNIDKKYPVLDLLDKNIAYNPFIKKANQMNKETRSKPLAILQALNEVKKEKITGEPAELGNFKYGGYNKNPFKKQWGGAATGAVTGAKIGSLFPGWGTAIGGVAGGLIGGIGGLFTKNKSNKEAERRRLELQKLYGQLNTNNDKALDINNATTFAKAAIPIPEYNYLNLDKVSDNIDSTYNRIELSENSRRNSAMANPFVGVNTGVRALTASGASSADIQNYLASNTGAKIHSSNAQGAQSDQYFDNMSLSRLGAETNVDQTLAGDKQFGLNQTGDRRYNKNMNTVGEFGNNQSTHLDNSSNLLLSEYTNEQALNSALAGEAQAAQAAWQTSLQTVGNGASSIYNMKKQGDLLDSQKNYFDTLSTGAVNPFKTTTIGGYDYIEIGGELYRRDMNGNLVKKGN